MIIAAADVKPLMTGLDKNATIKPILKRGNFMYWLNELKMPKTVKKYCPDTTMWTRKRVHKDVYLLKENDASRINLNFDL